MLLKPLSSWRIGKSPGEVGVEVGVGEFFGCDSELIRLCLSAVHYYRIERDRSDVEVFSSTFFHVLHISN